MKFFFGVVLIALVALASSEKAKTKLHPVNAVLESEADSAPNARNRRGFVYTSPAVAAPAVAATPIAAAPIAATAPVAVASSLPVAYASYPYASYPYASYPYAYPGYSAYAGPLVL